MSTSNETCIDICNGLLRGEISAVETYTQALEKFSGSPEVPVLEALLQDHQESVATLTSHIAEMGGKPSEGSGAWGAFAKAVEGSAKVFGETAALSALIAGEKSGINDYESALSKDDVMTEIKDQIRDTLLPLLQSHVIELEDLKA